MFHNSQAVLAISKEPNPTVFQKTLGVNDYYFASDAWEFPMGNIQMVGKSVADMYRGEKPLMTKLAPTFSLGGRGRARRRLLALHRGPAPAGEPGSVDSRWQADIGLPAPATTPRGTACSSSCARCSATWACTSTI